MPFKLSSSRIVAAVLVMAPLVPLPAQAVYGNISGTITDATGLPVPAAKIAVQDLDRGGAYPTTTAPTGEYAQGHLLAGHYRVEVTAPGFATLPARWRFTSVPPCR